MSDTQKVEEGGAEKKNEAINISARGAKMSGRERGSGGNDSQRGRERERRQNR